jgi:hypothetical protein
MPPPITNPKDISIGGEPSLSDWERWEASGKNAISQVVNDIGKMFTDMIGHGKSFWEAFKGLGKSAAGAMADIFLKTMLHSFLDPWADKLGKWMETISDKLTKVAKDFGLSIGAALAGGLIANKASGGSTAFTVAGAAGGFALGELQKGDVLGAAIAGAVAAGAAIVGTLRSFGNTHNKANEFVKQVQNPFGDALKQIVDANNALVAAGKQTTEGAQAARAAVVDLWAQFTDAANAFASKGGDQARVVAQAFAQLDPLIKQIESDIDSGLTGLIAKADEFAKNPLNPIFDSFRASLKPADDLNAELDKLAGAFDQKDIVSVYADQIISAAEAQRRHGFAVTGMVAALEAAARSYNATASTTDKLTAKRTGPPPMPQTGLAKSASQRISDFADQILSTIGSADPTGALASAFTGIVATLTTVPAPTIPAATAVTADPFTLATRVFTAAVDQFGVTVARFDTAPARQPTSITFAPVIAPEIHIDGARMTIPQIREEIAGELTSMLHDNIQGLRDQWAHELELA